ncbi:MAG: hypothetical protein WBP22_01050 [Candidatus Saccharimonas sp.]
MHIDSSIGDHVAPQLVGRAVSARDVNPGLDVVQRQARSNGTYRNRDTSAIHSCARVVELLRYGIEPTTILRTRLFGRTEDLDVDFAVALNGQRVLIDWRQFIG